MRPSLTQVIPMVLVVAISLGVVRSVEAVCGHLWVGCENGNMHVQYDVRASAERPEVVGYLLCRRGLGRCGNPLRLTAAAWSRTPAADAHYELVDHEVEGDVKYIYTVVGVDNIGNEISLQDCYYDPPLVFASCGVAPIAYGTVSAGGLITPCNACWDNPARLFTFPPEMAQYLGTAIALLMYGDAGCYGDEGCVMGVEAFEVTPCTIGVDRASWGLVKQRFR